MSRKANPIATAGRPPAEFLEDHAPAYERQQPNTVLDQKFPSGCRRYIITAAQNATPVHEKFLAALQQACKALDARLVVITLRYKNPTSRWTGSQRNAEWWAPAVRPYLYNQRRRLNSNLTLAADVKTQPTASRPLMGFEALTGHESMILGHTKRQMMTVAAPAAKFPKIMTTTGVCTVVNYTDSRAGKVGEFHHCLGAVLVELDGPRFHLRHLHADSSTGVFTDLDTVYTASGAKAAPPPLALVMGDTHVGFIDPMVEAATFGKGGIVQILRPKHLVWHDLLDGYSVNPHHFRNPFTAFAKRASGWDLVRNEVERAANFVIERSSGCQSIVVPSNHNDFLRRWVISTDWREDPANAQFYLETALAMIQGTKFGDRGTDFPDPFTYWLRHHTAGAQNIRCLDPDESFTLGGIELGMHGDIGPNGARGSINNLRRIGVKSIVGHSHSPGIEEGCYQVGTSTRLRLEYTHGPSSWMNTHGLLHADGRRQLVNIIYGKWRL